MPLIIKPPRAETPASSEGSAYTDDVAPDRTAGKSRFQTMVSPRPKRQREMASRALSNQCTWNNKYVMELDSARSRPLIYKMMANMNIKCTNTRPEDPPASAPAATPVMECLHGHHYLERQKISDVSVAPVYNSQLAHLAAISAKISPYDFVKHNIGAQGKGRAQQREEQRKQELRHLESDLFGANQKVVQRWKASRGTHGQKVLNIATLALSSASVALSPPAAP